MVGRYIINILVAIDQAVNAILGGDPDETLSSRAWKLAKAGMRWPARVIDRILGRGHCEAAAEEDEGKNKVIK